MWDRSSRLHFERTILPQRRQNHLTSQQKRRRTPRFNIRGSFEVIQVSRMAPPMQPFHVAELPTAIQSVPVEYKLKRRKVRDFNLENCELLEMVQFSCDPPEVRLKKPVNAPIHCEPVVRLFRRYVLIYFAPAVMVSGVKSHNGYGWWLRRM